MYNYTQLFFQHLLKSVFAKGCHLVLLLLVMLVLFTNAAYATHNRAGEITYTQVSEFSYSITITTFTNTRPTTSGWPPVDRPSLEIDFGDNTTAMVSRTEMIDLPDYYRKNTYITTHTFPGPGTYELVVEDPNRNEGVSNIPNSVAVVFSIKTIMQINPAMGTNSAPQLLSPPIDKAAKGRVFIHNPAAWDPDGDSLSYELTPCTGENGEPISGFDFPEGMEMNNQTGDLVWDRPQETGAFNVAILIEEWRSGVKIGQITRDLQIEVLETDNMPPDILSVQEKCVQAGDSLTINLKIFDPDGDSLKVTPLGGAFELADGARFTKYGSSGDTLLGRVVWRTNCNHIRRQPYLLVLKVEDYNADVVLADLHNIQIWVNGPPTQFTSIEPTNNSISLSWFMPQCNATGFTLYRKNESALWAYDSCLTGVPANAGYTKIEELDASELSYIDNNQENGLQQGFYYCYRIVPQYDDALGYSSQEACAELVRGIPIITNVSVQETSVQAGEMLLVWSKPMEIDTIEHPGPYTYKVYRSPGFYGNSFSDTPVFVSSGLNDTVFTDSGLNTLENPYSYKVELHNTQGLVSQPMVASSLWLNANGADQQIELSVQKNTPWVNHLYRFSEVLPNGEVLLDEVTETSFLHTGLHNGESYQYKVESEGWYSEDGLVKPIINISQIAVGIPLDTLPPDPPRLQVAANCDAFYNEINWQVTTDDVVSVQLFYAPDVNAEQQPVGQFSYPDTTGYQHFPKLAVSGCYSALAIDSAGNESSLSTRVCIDSCDFYELPNAITVNEDGKNDVFRPMAEDYIIEKTIASAEIEIFNRWGNLVFTTTDPLILWRGHDKNSNRLVSPGVYYYVCNLRERRISGVEERYKVGFVHVYHRKND
jgi:gliding motility-associated-like protein